MDMVFRDDDRIRSAHAPANFATIKPVVTSGWDEDFLYSLLTT